MFNYSENTRRNKELKIKELLKLIDADKNIQKEAAQIEKMILSHVLSADTMNMRASENVKEIYIIDVLLKERFIPLEFIKEVDKEINFQTIFRFKCNKDTLFVLSSKIMEEGKVKMLSTFKTEWMAVEKRDFNFTSNLENIYKQFLEVISSVKFLPNEDLADFDKRVIKIKTLQAEIAKHKRIMISEKQPNIKMAINDKIKKYQKQLEEITNG